ncbi:glycosyltransferase [Merdibacter massiliensis]|uniref:glycosyltransferase n=1 Tax=Merdibacter massiliensis TaxID=1871030 RepID=UPI00096A57B8|nr:glycosyltransferase [Merdibacter massiliensis]
MVKVLQVIGGLNRGGAETMIMNIFRNIDRSKYLFYFLVYYPQGVTQDYEEEVLNMGGKVIHFKQKFLIYDIFKLKKIMLKEKIDIVHAHTLFNSSISILAAKMANVPIRITHSHSTGQMKRENLLMKMYMSISKKIILSFSTKLVACGNDAASYLFGKHGENVIILNNAIDINIFKPKKIDALKYFDLIQDSKVKIGCIGSFYKVKNHSFLIELAFWMKQQKITNIKFYLVGKGNLRIELENKIKELDLSNYFCFLGTRNDIDCLMNIFDVLVMPSLYEGIPVTLIEAQACGIPCLVSKNVSSQVDLGLNLVTFLDINGNFKEWYEAIMNLKGNKLLEKDIKLINCKLHDKKYTIEQSLKLLECIYNGAIYK